MEGKRAEEKIEKGGKRKETNSDILFEDRES